MTTDLTQLPAHALLELYKRGETSPVEVTQAVLTRAARVNPKINAFSLLDEKSAMASAKESEIRWQAHRQSAAPVGALEGVPASIKDLILTQGWPTLRGSRTVDPHQAWDVDAPVTARLRESGPDAIVTWDGEPNARQFLESKGAEFVAAYSVVAITDESLRDMAQSMGVKEEDVELVPFPA